jgi:hypothetical protein
MKETFKLFVLPVTIAGLLSTGIYFLVGKPSFDAEVVCAQKGGYMVRTYSGTVCAKLEVIK